MAKNRSKYVTELVTPKKTPKILEAEVPRTAEKGVGIFKRSTVKPTTRESQIISEVSRIREVMPKKSVQQNYNAINKENVKLARQLERDVSKSRATVSAKEMSQAIDDSIGTVVAESPIIVGNLQTTATRVAEKAKKIILSNDETAIGLLKSRKEFDAWVRTLPRGEAKLATDAAMEAQSVAIKTVRNTMNDMLDAKVKSTAVKRELKRQSLLYDALDNMTPKAAQEANSAIGRSWQNTFKVLGIRNKAIQGLAMAAGVGGLGAAAKFAPLITLLQMMQISI